MIQKVLKVPERKRNRLALTILLVAALLLLTACSSQDEKSSAGSEYAKNFKLSKLSADPIKTIDSTKSFADPTYSTLIRRATSAKDGQTRMRHEYSRRQAFNADKSRLLAQDGSGHWFLYDSESGKLVKKLSSLAGDCEPIWHPSDPDKLYFTERGGGTSWWLLDISAGKKQLIYDFAEKSPWPKAASYWTKGEGTMSADGRYLTLIASSYDEGAQTTKAYGLVMLDLKEKKIKGSLSADHFPTAGALPDHVSTAPSGKYAVVSWLAESGGTVAYSADFSSSKQLTEGSEHSDLAKGRQGEDLLIYADYNAGYILSVDLASGKSEKLHSLYPAEGEGYAVHISGQAFDKPGWAVVSTYADYSHYGDKSPALKLRAEYRKVWLMELKPGGRRLNVAHVRSNEKKSEGDEAYFLEPQASASRDLSKIIFASNMGGPIESYIVELPEWGLD